MNLHLRTLRAIGPESCEAEFETSSGNRLIAQFRVDVRDGIATAAATPDVFREFDGTAEEQRQIIAAVVAFCRVSPRQLEQ